MTEPKPWLSLPDEEPPERGLAELMAAARMKAEVMARPPWWRRVFDLLRRPPVLALATIVVLLGGVIVVGHHPDQVQSPAVTAEPPEPLVPATPRAEVVATPPTAVVAPPQVVAPKHVTKKPPIVKAEPKTSDPEALQLAMPQAAPDMAAEGDDEAPVQAGTTKADGPAGAKAGKANAAPDPLARCRAAAVRKDCAGAKACARAVEKADPSYYRANATRDAALKSCL